MSLKIISSVGFQTTLGNIRDFAKPEKKLIHFREKKFLKHFRKKKKINNACTQI